jgi:hypothetical protein
MLGQVLTVVTATVDPSQEGRPAAYQAVLTPGSPTSWAPG